MCVCVCVCVKEGDTACVGGAAGEIARAPPLRRTVAKTKRTPPNPPSDTHTFPSSRPHRSKPPATPLTTPPASRPPPPRPRPTDDASFLARARTAWRVLFPPRPAALNPREAGKNRLRMILVADRCGMNQSSLAEMKTSIVNALSAFVEVDSTEAVDVNVSTDDSLGTIYSVAIPVRRIKPQAQVGVSEGGEGDGSAWETDPEADAADRFPYGV